MTINVNIPKIDTASFQPDFSKTLVFPGFTVYHSLKERYFIFPDATYRTEYDPLLDALDIVEGFAYLVGNNTNNFYTAQCEHALLLKTQVNPGTGDVINEEIIDIGDIVEAELSSTETFIGCGYVDGNTILLGVATNPGAPGDMEGHILLSTDNAQSWDFFNMVDGQFATPQGIPIAIVKINFNTINYYWILLRYQTGNDYGYYIIPESGLSDAPIGSFPIIEIGTAASPATHNNSTRFSINVQAKWNNNCIYYLNDTREVAVELQTNLHSGQWNDYVIPIFPIEPFVEVEYQPGLGGERFTHLNMIPGTSTSRLLKLDDLITNSSNPNDYEEVDSEHFLLWNRLDPFNRLNNYDIINYQPYTDDLIVLRLDGTDLSVAKGQFFNDNPLTELALNNTPIDRWNTPGFSTGILVDPLPAGWLANDATSSWVSDRADTDAHDYGALDFDYNILLSVDMPLAQSVTFRLQYYGEVVDIRVDGVSTAQSFSGAEGTWVNATVNLPRGPADIQFDMRNPANPGPGNPTGLRVEFDNLIDLTSLIAANGYSDIFVDEVEDKFYVLFDTLAWVCTLSTFTIDYAADLHAEQLVLNPPYPPGWNPTAINGVTDDIDVPVQWKFLKNFNDVYVYNTKHDTTYSSVLDKEFYLWRFLDTDPTGIQMFSAFTLPVDEIAKIQYFEDFNGELHIMTTKTSPIETIQYRLNGLAQFGQNNTDPVSVGPVKFSDVYVGLNGHVYVSEGDDPGHSQLTTDLFVYKNDNAGDIDNGSYLIAVDPSSNPYTFESFSLPTVVGDENFGLAKKFMEIPGDYTANFIIGSTEVRTDTYEKITDRVIGLNYMASASNPNAQLPITSQVVAAKIFGDWTYVLTYETGISQYRMYRTRAVYYPYTVL